MRFRDIKPGAEAGSRPRDIKLKAGANSGPKVVILRLKAGQRVGRLVASLPCKMESIVIIETKQRAMIK